MSRSPTPATSTRQRGADVECAARDYLLKAGLTDVTANAGYRVGEIDLVMLDATATASASMACSAATLVFVEVRYRRSTAFGGGAASVDAAKCRRLIRAAQSFLATQRQYAGMPCRFDVVDASGDPAALVLRWLKDAFRADDV